MWHSVIALVIVAPMVVPPQPPGPPLPPESVLTVPAGSLPWAVPVLPIPSIDLDIGTTDFDEVEHTEDYATNLAAIEARFSDTTGINADAGVELDTWIGEEGIIPDMSAGGDFETGISVPGYADTSAYAIATELGTNIGTLFSYIRALASFDAGLGGVSTLIGFVILCCAWMALVVLIKFAIQFVDMIFSVAAKIIELIPVAE